MKVTRVLATCAALFTGALFVFATDARCDWLTVDCRPGNPSGAQFSTVSDAVSYLNSQRPALGSWDTIALRSDCTDNVYLTRSQVWIAPEWDSCPWAGCTTNGAPARITAADPGSPVVSVEGPHDIMLVHLVLAGGSSGLGIGGAAAVPSPVVRQCPILMIPDLQVRGEPRPIKKNGNG